MIDETSTIMVPVKVTFPRKLISWHSVYVYPFGPGKSESALERSFIFLDEQPSSVFLSM